MVAIMPFKKPFLIEQRLMVCLFLLFLRMTINLALMNFIANMEQT